MLNDLHIKNFRMLEDLHIAKLGRVNLIVGKNNCGKSTVLEALHLYGWRAHPDLLKDILVAHNEFLGHARLNTGGEDAFSWSALENLFSGRKFPAIDDQPILIKSSQTTLLRLEHELYRQVSQPFGSPFSPSPSVTKKDAANLYEPLYQRIKVSFGASHRDEYLDFWEQSRQYFFARNSVWLQGGGLPFVNIGYVPTQLLAGQNLAASWDQILMRNRDAVPIVMDGLRIVQPDVEILDFIQDSYNPMTRVPVVQLKGMSRSNPLGSMGDGMSRILQILLAVYSARDGLLLIDEFENGLHYSVQEKVWQMIFKLANDLNIQVFATTHSRDCIESFTKIAVEDANAEGVLLKLARSRLTGKVIARVYDEADLQTITASELEIR